MTNPFRDQEKFMRACDQSTASFDHDQFKLYTNLIEEEVNELFAAIRDANDVEKFLLLEHIRIQRKK